MGPGTGHPGHSQGGPEGRALGTAIISGVFQSVESEANGAAKNVRVYAFVSLVVNYINIKPVN